VTGGPVVLPRPGSSLLNDRDRYLLWLLAEDYTTAELARVYRISRPDAERRVRVLLAKTGAGSREELVATALRCGWISLDRYGVAA